jgi:hypothetical protein
VRHREKATVILTLLTVSLSAVALSYGAYLLWTAACAGQLRPSGEAIVLGAVTNFFDTLGIRGSLFRSWPVPLLSQVLRPPDDQFVS